MLQWCKVEGLHREILMLAKVVTLFMRWFMSFKKGRILDSDSPLEGCSNEPPEGETLTPKKIKRIKKKIKRILEKKKKIKKLSVPL